MYDLYIYTEYIDLYIYIHTYLFNDENYVFLFCSQSISDQKNIIYKKYSGTTIKILV